ncbi:MAG: ankyrin repeat domain-containing protein [Rhizomicrobium sp.]|jgi:ankyrin repeat protein
MLFAAHAQVNAGSREGVTAFFIAAQDDRPELMRALVDAGADINAATAAGKTPPMAASGGGAESPVNILIDAGVDTNAHTPDGTTALILAAQGGHSNICYKLIHARAEENARAGALHRAALMFAAEAGKIDAVRTLLDNGADVNAKTNETPGRTALDLANANQHEDVSATLVAAGARSGLGAQ